MQQEEEEEEEFPREEFDAAKQARREQVRRFLNNLKNMETPEYLRSLAAVQDSHRIL